MSGLDTALMALARTRAADDRINEVARLANDIQRETGCTRTEALAAAEKLVPHPTHV